MTQPHEAHGLTAALAKSIDRIGADLAALLADPNYLAQLKQLPIIRGSRRASRALQYLYLAKINLGELAESLAPPAPNAPTVRELFQRGREIAALSGIAKGTLADDRAKAAAADAAFLGGEEQL